MANGLKLKYQIFVQKGELIDSSLKRQIEKKSLYICEETSE